MSDEEAHLAAILPPEGHVVPPAPVRDQLFMPFRLGWFAWQFIHERPRINAFPLGSNELRSSMYTLLATLGFDLTVYGLERLDPAGQVLMWNQTSHLDHLILGAAIPVPFRSIYNLEVAKIPLYREWMKRDGHFLVDRFDRAQWQATVRAAADWIRAGNTLLVSPEGTRSWDGKLLRMKRGALEAAVLSGRPILPILFYGAHEGLPRGRFTVQPGRIEVEYRAPVPTEGHTLDDLDRLGERIGAAMQEGLDEGPPSKRTRPSP